MNRGLKGSEDHKGSEDRRVNRELKESGDLRESEENGGHKGNRELAGISAI